MNKLIFFSSVLFLVAVIACEQSEVLDPSFTLSETDINYGDVEIGNVIFDTITVEGQNINGSLFVSISGSGFSVADTLLPVANLENEVIIILSPTPDTPLGSLTGELTLSGADYSQTVTLSANILEAPFTGLPFGTVVFENDFNFSDPDKLELIASDFEETAMVHESVEVEYVLVRSTEALDNENRISIRTQFSNTRCSNGTAGDFEEDGVTPCGSALRIVGKEAEATSVTFNLTGLEAERSYTIVYYVRPNGTSERAMTVSITGDAEQEYVFIDADVSTFEMYERIGQADADGMLSVKFEYSADSNSRSIAIDDLIITVI